MKRLIAIVIMLIEIFTLTSCSAQEGMVGKGYDKNIIHVNQGITHVLTRVIMEKDFLTLYLPDDVTVEWGTIGTSPEIRDGIVSGDIDISVLSSPATITAVERGLPVYILSGHATNGVGLYSKNPDMKSAQDLLNANGIYTSSLSSFTSLAIMAMCKDEFGDALTLSEKFIAMEGDFSLPAFEASDDVDCIGSSFPNSVRAMQIEGVHEVVDLTPYAQKYDLGNYYIVNKDFYENNPVLIEAFRKAQQDALDFMINNPDECAELLAESFELDKEIIAEEMKTSIPKLEVTGYDKCAELLYEAGILEKQPMKFSELPNYEEIPK